MKKIWILILLCFQIGLAQNCFANYYTQKIELEIPSYEVFINGVAIRAYKLERDFDTVTFVYVEDLIYYGFEVIKDEENKILTVKRIPEKEPEGMPFNANKEENKFYFTYMNVFLEGLKYEFDHENGLNIASKSGTLIDIRNLGFAFGEGKSIYEKGYYDDLPTKMETTILYNYAAAKCALTNFTYAAYMPYHKYMYEKWNIEGDWFKEYAQYHLLGECGNNEYYFEMETSIDTPNGKTKYKTRYVSLNFLESLKLQYIFTENGLEIPSGQKVSYNEVEDVLNQEKVIEPNQGSSSVNRNPKIWGDFSCVDINVTADGKGTEKYSVFPAIVCASEGFENNMFINGEILEKILGFQKNEFIAKPILLTKEEEKDLEEIKEKNASKEKAEEAKIRQQNEEAAIYLQNWYCEQLYFPLALCYKIETAFSINREIKLKQRQEAAIWIFLFAVCGTFCFRGANR